MRQGRPQTSCWNLPNYMNSPQVRSVVTARTEQLRPTSMPSRLKWCIFRAVKWLPAIRRQIRQQRRGRECVFLERFSTDFHHNVDLSASKGATTERDEALVSTTQNTYSKTGKPIPVTAYSLRVEWHNLEKSKSINVIAKWLKIAQITANFRLVGALPKTVRPYKLYSTT